MGGDGGRKRAKIMQQRAQSPAYFKRLAAAAAAAAASPPSVVALLMAVPVFVFTTVIPYCMYFVIFHSRCDSVKRRQMCEVKAMAGAGGGLRETKAEVEARWLMQERRPIRWWNGLCLRRRL
jgi:hypothetical protein